MYYTPTDFTIVHTGEGKRIAYNFTAMDEDGNVVNSNQHYEFVVMDDDLEQAIQTLENGIREHLNKKTSK